MGDETLERTKSRPKRPFAMRKALVVLLFVLVPKSLIAQDKPQPISIHVREVHRTPETFEGGVMVHITAIVETKTTVYSVRCDAFTKSASDTTKRNLICGDLAAGHDYDAWKYFDAISLWKFGTYSGSDRRILYSIVSEKEKKTE